MITEEQKKYQEEKDRQEAIEHRDVLLAIASFVKSKEGLNFFKYLFKNFNVGELPERGLTGNDLYEYLGFLRAGNSIYKLICEVDAEVAATILSKIEREKYDDKIRQYQLEQQLINN